MWRLGHAPDQDHAPLPLTPAKIREATQREELIYASAARTFVRFGRLRARKHDRDLALCAVDEANSPVGRDPLARHIENGQGSCAT